MKPNVLCQLFDAFVGSILNYSSEVWGYTKSKEIQRVHLKFCKPTTFTLRVRHATHCATPLLSAD